MNNGHEDDAPNGFDQRIAERSARRPSNLNMNKVNRAYEHQGDLPNTACTVSVIAFLLGAGFAFSFATFALTNNTWWHLSFFVGSWCLFHWAEFAVTAGWNAEKCTVDCEFYAAI